MRTRLFRCFGLSARWLTIATVVLFAATTAMAQAPETIFQLDGNPADDHLANCVYAGDCDYWNLINGTGVSGVNVGHSSVNTFIPGFNTSFGFQTGGSKDYLPISQWQYSAAHGPNKDAFGAGYAAGYNLGDFDVIFGADRQSNSGDANIGIWFFQDNVSLNASGGFNGVHKNGDVLVTSAFTSGGGTSSIFVFIWDQPGLANAVKSKDGQVGCASASKVPKNTSPVGYCILQNLLYVAAPAIGTECTSGSPYCAVTNSSTVNASWATAANGYPSGSLASPLFFEGGVDITQAFASFGATVPCFASFLEDTRSSQSPDAILHFFLLGQFPVCSISIIKQCPTGSLVHTANGDVFQYTFGGVVKNGGIGTIHNVVVTDTFPSDATAITPQGTGTGATGIYSLGDLGAGLCKEFPSGNSVTCPNPFAVPPGAPATDFTSDTFQSLMNAPTNSASVASTEVSAGSVSATCPSISGTPAINVTKSCTATLSSSFTAGVTYNGDVCNESNLTLTITSTQGEPTDVQVNGTGTVLLTDTSAAYSTALPFTLKACTATVVNSMVNPTPCTIGQTCSDDGVNLHCTLVDNSQTGTGVCAHYSGGYIPTQASTGTDTSSFCLRDKLDVKAHSAIFNKDATAEAFASCPICPDGTCKPNP